jgi:hypothetical protein
MLCLRPALPPANSTPKTATAIGASHPTRRHDLQQTVISQRVIRHDDTKTTSQPYPSHSVSDGTNRSQRNPPSTNDFFNSNVLSAKRQPLQQHSFNAPAPAATSTAAAAAAAALPFELFSNPTRSNISPQPQQGKHQQQPARQQHCTCVTIEQLLQAASSASDTTAETISQRQPHLHR